MPGREGASSLWSPNKIQEVETDKLFLALVTRMGIGTDSPVVVGGFAPRAGANVNNNYDDNDNIGVAPGVSAEILFLPH